MEIFEFNWTQSYGDGVLIIAANDREEAEKLARNDSKWWEFGGRINELKYVGKSTEPHIIVNVRYQE